MKTPAASLPVTLAAGGNQLINWGISFYMPGTFARAIAQDTGWSSAHIYLGLTLAMLMMALLSPWAGAGALAGAALVCLYYTVMSRRQFGGITGDLAGFFLQLCELAVVLGAAVGMRLEVFG